MSIIQTFPLPKTETASSCTSTGYADKRAIASAMWQDSSWQSLEQTLPLLTEIAANFSQAVQLQLQNGS
jgi:hypothetical protein